MDPGVRAALDKRFDVQEVGIKSTLNTCGKDLFDLNSKLDECSLL